MLERVTFWSPKKIRKFLFPSQVRNWARIGGRLEELRLFKISRRGRGEFVQHRTHRRKVSLFYCVKLWKRGLIKLLHLSMDKALPQRYQIERKSRSKSSHFETGYSSIYISTAMKPRDFGRHCWQREIMCVCVCVDLSVFSTRSLRMSTAVCSTSSLSTLYTLRQTGCLALTTPSTKEAEENWY